MTPDYQRIISLVPSLTELLVDLGLKDRLVGRTRFCIHPGNHIKDIPIIGGTKNPRLDKIREASPDFILANKEENRKKHIEELALGHRVHVTDIASIEDALITIHQLGNELGVSDKSKQLIRQISNLLEVRPDEPPLRTAYLIWRNPWMTIGSDTYIHDVMNHWRLINVFKDNTRYPKIKLEDLKTRQPQLVLLSSEPYPFKEKHIPEVEEALPGTRILVVDGEWFSWYGSRMLNSFEKLNVWRKAIA